LWQLTGYGGAARSGGRDNGRGGGGHNEGDDDGGTDRPSPNGGWDPGSSGDGPTDNWVTRNGTGPGWAPEPEPHGAGPANQGGWGGWLQRFRYASSGEGLVEQGAPFGYPDEMLNLAATDPQLAAQLGGPAAIHLAVPVVLGGGVVAWSAATQFAPIYAGGVGAMAAPGYRTFEAFKHWFGEAGVGNHWHHVVEQTTANVARFGPAVIHTANNLYRVATPIHRQISAFYSSVQPLISGSLTVRDWLSTQGYEFQYEFGFAIMRAFGAIK
jgi:hypothetical protein